MSFSFNRWKSPRPGTMRFGQSPRGSRDPADWHLMRAKPFFVRLGNGFLKPKNPILGFDMAGRVEAVGSSVTQFQPVMRCLV